MRKLVKLTTIIAVTLCIMLLGLALWKHEKDQAEYARTALNGTALWIRQDALVSCNAYNFG